MPDAAGPRFGVAILANSGADAMTVYRTDLRALEAALEASGLVWRGQGVIGSRPAAGVQGGVYWVPGTGLYYDDGLTWTVVSSSATVDDVAGVGSLRTLGAGAQQAAAGNHAHGISGIVATGTPSATTFLRGDGTWSGMNVIGYDLYAWTPSASDQYPIQVVTGGTAITFTAAAGRPSVGPAANGPNEVVGRYGLMRVPAASTTPGTITFGGSIRYTGALTDSVVALGLSDQLSSGNWGEGVAIELIASSGSAKVWSRTGSGYSPSSYTGGTQRGSTVTGLTAGTWYQFSLAVSAAGNLTAVFNGSTVFNGPAVVDLVDTIGLTPSWAVQCTTAAAVSVGACSVTYS